MPEVTVVVPAYNAERWIGEALRSIQSQTFGDVEIIVVDDGSRDGTAAIVDSFGPPVRRIHQRNGGVARARNEGIRAAAGRLVAFLDADDLWDAPKMERQVALLRSRPEVGLCYSGIRRIDGEGRVRSVEPARDYPDLCQTLLLRSCVIAVSSAVVRRELLDQLGGFDPVFSQCADWDLWIRLSRLTACAAVAEPMVRYRTAPGNMSSDVSLLERDTLAVLDKFFASDDAYPYLSIKRRCYGNHWMILAGSYLHHARLADSLRALVNGLRFAPGNVWRALGLPVRWAARLLQEVRSGEPRP